MKFNYFNRTPDDICLLCKTNKATKTESHILSKFLGKELKQSNKNRFNGISSDGNHSLEQDLPKHDYLYCPDCEKKFEIIETDVSRLLLQINNFRYSNNFHSHKIRENELLMKNIKLEPCLLLLFIYIQVWRIASFVNAFSNNSENKKHSSYRLFENFNLDFKIVEKLRETLNTHLFLTKTELRTNIENIKIQLPIYPFGIFTHDGKISKDSRFFDFGTTTDNTALLSLSNYKLVVFFNLNISEEFIPYINKTKNDANFVLLGGNTWDLFLAHMEKLLVSYKENYK